MILFLAGIAFFFANIVPVQASEKLTLEQSVEIAIRNASPVIKAQNDVELSGEQLLQSYAQFLPTLDLSTSYYYSSGKTLYTFSGANLVNSISDNASFGLSSRLNLFNGLADFGGLKSALARKNFSQVSLTWAKDQIALDVIQSYLKLILDQQLVDIAKKNLQASQGRLKFFQESTEIGGSSTADLYRQQAQTSSDELLLSSYEARLNDDRTLLIRKLRVDPAGDYDFIIPSLELESAGLGSRALPELIQIAKSKRTDLMSALLKEEYTAWDVTRARGDYYPKLNLSFDRSAVGHYLLQQIVNGADVLPATQQDLIPQLGNQVNYTISLTLTWNLFDRFLTRQNVAQANVLHLNAEADLTDLQFQIESDVRVSFNDYLIAQKQLESAKTGLAAAIKAFEAIQGKYRVGQATFIDLLSAQTALLQAQFSQVQALVNLKLQEKSLQFSLGLLRGK